MRRPVPVPQSRVGRLLVACVLLLSLTAAELFSMDFTLESIDTGQGPATFTYFGFSGRSYLAWVMPVVVIAVYIGSVSTSVD